MASIYHGRVKSAAVSAQGRQTANKKIHRKGEPDETQLPLALEKEAFRSLGCNQLLQPLPWFPQRLQNFLQNSSARRIDPFFTAFPGCAIRKDTFYRT